MKRHIFYTLMTMVTLLFVASVPGVSIAQGFAGTWNVDKAQSKHADFFDEAGIILRIIPNGENKMTIEQVVTSEYDEIINSTNVDLNGSETISEWSRGDLPIFGYEAVAIGSDQTVKTKAVQGTAKSSFDLISYFTVVVSQGTYNIVLHSHYQLSPDGKTLTVTNTRNSREQGEPVIYVFHRMN
ncbi:MAG: hypothetical protein ACYDA4_11475 [Ignavibacteriaceae bacterium]